MRRFGWLSLVCALILAASLVRVADAQAQESVSAEAVTNDLGNGQVDLVYVPVTPCRIIDTRVSVGGILAVQVPQAFRATGATSDLSSQGGSATGCGIPSGATAIAVNFGATQSAGPGNLRAYAFAAGATAPLASVLNFGNLAPVGLVTMPNASIVPICDPAVTACTSDLLLQAFNSATHVVADVVGYFHKTSALFLKTDNVSYSLAAGADSAPISLPANVPVQVMGCQLEVGFRGVAQVTLLRIPGQFLEWVGLESPFSAAITSGFSAAPGTHILWLDFSHLVDLRVASADTFVVHNANPTVQSGVVRLIW